MFEPLFLGATKRMAKKKTTAQRKQIMQKSWTVKRSREKVELLIWRTMRSGSNTTRERERARGNSDLTWRFFFPIISTHRTINFGSWNSRWDKEQKQETFFLPKIRWVLTSTHYVWGVHLKLFSLLLLLLFFFLEILLWAFDSATNLHNNERYQSNCLSMGVEGFYDQIKANEPNGKYL